MSTSKLLGPEEVNDELARSIQLICTGVRPEEHAFVLVSGGLDSDVVARLAAAAVTPARLLHGCGTGTLPEALDRARHLGRSRAGL